MSKIKELREKAMRLGAEARAKLTEADQKGKTPDEIRALNAEFDRLMEERDALTAQADRLERADLADREAEELRARTEREERESRRSTGGALSFAPAGNLADEYRAHFGEFLAAGGDLSAISAEARSALRAGFVQGENRAQVTTTGAAGGYTVPAGVASFIAIAMAAHGPMLDGSFVSELVTGNGVQIPIPGIDDTSEEGADHTEGDDLAAGADLVLTKTDLGAYTAVTPYIKWSYELSQDSQFSWEQILGNLIGERLARRANKLLTIGTGTGQPLGVVAGAGVGATAAAAAALTFDDVIELEHSVDPAYRGGAKVGFMMHDQTVKLLRKVKNNDGDYIWRDGDLTKGTPSTLNGKVVRFNQAMAQVAASADVIAFGDFGQYYTRKVGSPLLGVAREKFFPNLGIAGVLRYDGALSDARAVKKLRMAAA